MATRPRLGELLLAHRICSREQLREAWEQRVLYGDRLGTNLLTLGFVDEHTLARALGQQHGVHSGSGKVISVDKKALKLIPKALAVKRLVVPHHVADKQLFLLMRDPLDPVALDEAAFAANMKITPIAVCEARVWQLMSLYYGVNLSMRPVPLDGVVRTQVKRVQTEEQALGPELTSEEDFQRLYASIHQPPSIDDHPPIDPDPQPDVVVQGQVLAPPRDERSWREQLENTQPMIARPRPSGSDEAEPLTLIDLVEAPPAGAVPGSGLRPAGLAEMAPPLVRQATADFHVPEQIVDDSPLGFDEATRVLSAATDRDAIARVVLRAARTRFARACLLSVFPDRLLGWMAIGEGMENIKDVVIERRAKSVFANAAENRSHYLGPLARWPSHGAWVKATGRQIPLSLAVFPIFVRGRPVNLLVVDNGHDQHVGSDVGEVLILAQQIAKTYETLLTVT